MSGQIVKIKVNPAVLKYARYLSGYNFENVAKKTKIKQEQLEILEQEEIEISIPRLEKLSSVYKMPLAFFLLKELPKDAILPSDFRIVYTSEQNNFSPDVMLAIRRARYIQSVFSDLLNKVIKYAFRVISLTSDVEMSAQDFRKLLNISIQQQSQWSTPQIALRNWKSAVENLNILIVQQSLPKGEVSAFSLADKIPYVIVLNSKEHENRRIFSLFHEMGHILLHRSGICTPDDLSKNSLEYKRIEKFCNQFAASLLVPYEQFVDDDIVKKLGKIEEEYWDNSDIRSLSNKFKVSQEVIYRRLMTINLLSEASYQKKRSELQKKFEEYEKKVKRKQEIRIPQYRKIISQNGRAYSSFILENLHANKITLVDAADYLGTNSRHIRAVELNL
jgi:Zn-dependent peptidase ImmA (M78 family)